MSIADKTASAKKQRLQFVEKVCFFKKVLVLNPYPQTPFPGKGAILLGLPPLDQARMLAVSHTKPLHDAVAQMADDLYGGYAPQPHFLITIEIFPQSEISIVYYPTFRGKKQVFNAKMHRPYKKDGAKHSRKNQC